jgi:hypothetical protein
MTPKEKAKELFNKYFDMKWQSYNIRKMSIKSMTKSAAKQCALIAVDEILTARPLEPNNVDWDGCGATHKYWYEEQKQEALNYWQEVKTEIEKL